MRGGALLAAAAALLLPLVQPPGAPAAAAPSYFDAEMDECCAGPYPKAADSLLIHGDFQFESFEPARLGLDPDWSEDPYGNRSWMLMLHAFYWMRPLLHANLGTGDPAYLRLALRLAEDWAADNPVEDPASEMSWHPQATALRLGWMLDLHEAARRDGSFGESELAGLRGIIDRQGEWLLADSHYAERTNVGLDQALALARLGLALPEVADANEFRKTGLLRLGNEVAYAYDPRGVHRENSPAYHIYMISRLFKVRRLYSAYGLDRAGLDDIIGKALYFTAFILQPSGELPLIGDSPMRAGLDKTLPAWVDRREEILYAFSKGHGGRKPSEVDLLLPESGYAIFRDRWGDARDFDEPLQVVVKFASGSRMHFHDDLLSFCLYARGERWIVDGGLYEYDYDNPLRVYATSRLAHNVVLVDEDARTAVPGPLPTAFVDGRAGASVAWVEAVYDLGGTARHRRTIFLIKPNRLLIHDELESLDGRPHEFKQIFHLDRDKSVRESEDGFAVASGRRSGETLTIRSLGPGVRLWHVRGRKHPQLQGWASYRKYEIEPVDAVGFILEGESAEFETLLRFGPAESGDERPPDYEALKRSPPPSH